ncbi:MAG TPA: hypothetical protein VKU00_18355 [Chthonomonadaceae bacterium]|nr:hypothetical protein [Chthonomonadaceae bacterium]
MSGKKKQTKEDANLQQTESVRQWIMSPEGQDTIVAGLQKAHRLAAQFREAQRVDPEILYKPITL